MVIIDPYVDSRLFNILTHEGVQIDYVLLTHEHYDHISGVNLLKETFASRILCSGLCAQNIQIASKNFSSFFPAFCDMQKTFTVTEEMLQVDDYVCSADEILHDGSMLNWQGHMIAVFETPGHSQGSTSYLLDNKYLFCGDSLFRDFPVQLRLPGGSKTQYHKITYPFFQTLSREVLFYPGHNDAFYINEILVDID